MTFVTGRVSFLDTGGDLVTPQLRQSDGSKLSKSFITAASEEERV